MAPKKPPPPPACDLVGPAKLKEVTRLLGKLYDDLTNICLLPHQRDLMLDQLKVYGRDPQDSDPIFTPYGIETLTRHALNSPSYTTSRNALRCLANSMLLKPATRQMFVNLGYEAKLCSRLKHDSRDDEFLISRIIFLTTYDTNINIQNLIDHHHLAENINLNLSRHAKVYDDKKSKAKIDAMEDMALTESLKLVFNITHFCSQRSGLFTPAIQNILKILSKRQLNPKMPMEAPIGSLINALINLEFDRDTGAMEALFPGTGHHTDHVERLIEILDLTIKSYKEEDIDKQLSPLLTLLRKIYGHAPRDVKDFMRSLIMPNDEDRKQPLGRTETLSSRLLRLTTSAVAPVSREQLSTLLFEMSDRDAKNFVQNVGYGFASGFLFQHNVPIPENALEAWSTSSNGDTRSSTSSTRNLVPPVTASSASSTRNPVNPVTGQTLESEPKFDGPEMTREEKEREAEKLMVLFERLRANGVITAENPMRKAQQEGRFEELDTDDDSD